MKYILDITTDDPMKVTTTRWDSLEDALTEVHRWVRPIARNASLPFHAWVQPWGIKQLTLDLRTTRSGWCLVNTNRVKNLIGIQISSETATRASTFSYTFDKGID